jgi:AsmA protein
LALLVLLLLALLVVTLLRIPLDLSRYKPLAEDAMSEALGRQVSIDGDMVVTTSLWPYFELGGLRIANPVDFPQGDLAVMDRARISVGILPLLQRRVEIREFRVSELTLDLVRMADGEANWVLERAAGRGADDL